MTDNNKCLFPLSELSIMRTIGPVPTSSDDRGPTVLPKIKNEYLKGIVFEKKISSLIYFHISLLYKVWGTK